MVILTDRLVDDCWSVKDHRDPNTGRILPDLDKFPDGIDGLADKIHDLGLKIGIYSSTLRDNGGLISKWELIKYRCWN
jgi:hypothetical protein